MFLYLVPVDDAHQPYQALSRGESPGLCPPMAPQSSMGFAQPDGFPISLGEVPSPADGYPHATDSESINLAAAAAALDAFQIGLFALTTANL